MYLIFRILVEKENREENLVIEYILLFWGEFVFLFYLFGCCDIF